MGDVIVRMKGLLKIKLNLRGNSIGHESGQMVITNLKKNKARTDYNAFCVTV